MVKVECCDICKRDGKLTEAKGRMQFQNHRELNISYCKDCHIKIPKDKIQYIKYACQVLMGIEITDEQARGML